MPRRSRNKQVFVNCPFDREYENILRAIVFAIAACGYKPRCALEAVETAEPRLKRLVAMIKECDRAIHDLSRQGVDPTTGLPRFNPPFELGLDIGLSKSSEKRKLLILDSHKFRYRTSISDICERSVASHDNDPLTAIMRVRNWLQNDTKRALPTPSSMFKSYQRMIREFPRLLREAQLHEQAELLFVEYVGFCRQWSVRGPVALR